MIRLFVTLAFCLCLLLPVSGWAQGAAKDPLSYPIRHYLLVLFMTLLGGFVGWYGKVRKAELPAGSLFALIGEMTTSALAGFGAFLVCDYFGVPIGITAASAGLCGYMGGRAIETAERWMLRRAERLGQAG